MDLLTNRDLERVFHTSSSSWAPNLDRLLAAMPRIAALVLVLSLLQLGAGVKVRLMISSDSELSAGTASLRQQGHRQSPTQS